MFFFLFLVFLFLETSCMMNCSYDAFNKSESYSPRKPNLVANSFFTCEAVRTIHSILNLHLIIVLLAWENSSDVLKHRKIWLLAQNWHVRRGLGMWWLISLSWTAFGSKMETCCHTVQELTNTSIRYESNAAKYTTTNGTMLMTNSGIKPT